MEDEHTAQVQAAERQLFSDWLTKHARGILNEEATAGLAEVVQDVVDGGKAGKLTITIVVAPAGPGGRTVTIGGTVVVKTPQPAPELGVFYVGERGSLHRDDPFQRRLPGVPVATGAEQQEVKTVPAPAGSEVRRVPDDDEDEES